jgi:hypothetical protein
MIFTIDPEFIAQVFERYERGLNALPDEWGYEYWEGEIPSEIQGYFSPKAHSLDHMKSLIEESFWASLEKEEGRYHNLQLVYCNYDLAEASLKIRSHQVRNDMTISAGTPILTRFRS